jgi:hypothetical protein
MVRRVDIKLSFASVVARIAKASPVASKTAKPVTASLTGSALTNTAVGNLSLKLNIDNANQREGLFIEYYERTTPVEVFSFEIASLRVDTLQAYYSFSATFTKVIAETASFVSDTYLSFLTARQDASILTASISLQPHKLFFEIVTYLDTFAIVPTKGVNELLIPAEALRFNVSATLIEFFTATDDILGEASIDDEQTASVGKFLVDYYGLSESIGLSVGFIRDQITDTFSQSELVSLVPNKGVQDYVGSVEYYEKVIGKNPEDVLAPSEVLVRDISTVLAQDSFLYSEVVLVSQGYSRDFEDFIYPVGFAEIVYIKANFNILPQDYVVYPETLIYNLDRVMAESVVIQAPVYLTVSRPVEDSVSGYDSLVFSASLRPTDGFGWVEVRTVTVSTIKTELTTLSEDFNKLVESVISELVGSQDNLANSAKKVLVDNSDLIEAVSASMNISVNNVSAMVEAVAATISNYFAADYTEPDYVGSTTYF